MDDVLLKSVEKAAAVICAGGVVAFPTETYYGLAVDPFNEAALDKLYRLKQRPKSKPLLTLIAHRGDLDKLVSSVPRELLPFMDLWPAPLTLVFPSLKSLSTKLTGGTSTIGVRISSNPVALALIKSCGIPITATSANISSQPPCHSIHMIHSQFGDQLDYILDGGSTPGGDGSTLIGLKNNLPHIIRKGVMPLESLSNLL